MSANTYTVRLPGHAAVMTAATWQAVCDRRLHQEYGHNRWWYVRDDGLVLVDGGRHVQIDDADGRPLTTRPYDVARDGPL